ncbi:MAG: universal stress protein [Anaerolineales bacterium]
MTEIHKAPHPNQALVCLASENLAPGNLQFTGYLLKILSFGATIACFQTENETEQQCRKLMHQAADEMGLGSYDQIILQDNLERSIVEQLDRGNYQLLVLGVSSCATDGLEQGLKQRLAEKAKTSVLFVQNPPQHLQRILVCTGGHKASEMAVLTSMEIAEASQSQLTILHIATAAPSMYAGLDAQDESLEQVLARQLPLSDHLREMAALAEKRGVEAKLELRHGVVIEEILRACDINPCDLLVVGTTQPRSFLNWLALGSVSPQLITSSDRPILIVRQQIQA